MAYPWGLIAFVVGIVWGLVIPGRQSKLGTLINGILVGLVVGVAFAVIGYFTNQNPLGFGTTIWEFVVAFFVNEKDTVPVGVPPYGGATVAVRVTDWPKEDELGPLSVTVGAAAVTVCATLPELAR